VYRAETADGIVWVKVPEAPFAHEARVIALLTPLAPELLPRVVAADERGWLAVADLGDEADVDWPPLLRRYARLQHAATPFADELVAAGAEDLRGEKLGERIGELVPGDARPQELCARIAASRIAPTIEHRDLRRAHVRNGVILDWGDACVAHPFLTLSRSEPRSALDAYLEAWPDEPETVAAVIELRFLWGALNDARVEGL
jgi:hypothetical protein